MIAFVVEVLQDDAINFGLRKIGIKALNGILQLGIGEGRRINCETTQVISE